jgi:hypothetical protein
MKKLPLPNFISTVDNKDILMGFDNLVLYLADRRVAKEVGMAMNDDLFAEWHLNNPPSLPEMQSFSTLYLC